MAKGETVENVASTILSAVGQLARRVRQLPVAGELTLAERTALGRLSREGPSTSAELARAEGISAQSMGVTLSALEARSMVRRGRDPHDGRRVVFSFTPTGVRWMKSSRDTRIDLLARALNDSFKRAEIDQLHSAAPLLERLAHTISIGRT